MRIAHQIPVALLLALCACTVGPDFQRPAAPPGAGFTAEPIAFTHPTGAHVGTQAAEQRFRPGADIPGEWWTLFHSEKLSALVAQALRANPSLDAAQAALRQAQENRLAQEGSFFPSVQASFGAQRNKVATGALATPASTPGAFYNLYTTQVSVSYVPDVFGLNRRTVESLDALAENQRFQLEATYLTLTSNLVTAAINEASLRAQIDATKRIIDLVRQSVALLRQQLALGSVARQDLLTQEAALAAAEATLPPLEKSLAQQRDALTALLGSLPNQQPPETFDLAALRLPADLPVSLPSQLVEQRPDVRVAEESWRSANALVGVAVANRLPQFTLDALVGSSPGRIAGLFGPGNGFFSLAGTAAQPVFEGFTLLHRQRSAQAGADLAAAQYRQTLITAFQNVADTLRALQADADALRTAQQAEQMAKESLEVARGQLRLGSVNNLVLLNAEQTYLQATLTLVQAQANRLTDTAALFQALGGGWWNRQDVPSIARPSLL